jgi:ribosomal protein S17E
MTNQDETKRPRNYAKEWTKRQEKNKRLIADLNRVKVERLQNKLAQDGQTYAKWLEQQIDRAFKEWDLFFLDDMEPCSTEVLIELAKRA